MRSYNKRVDIAKDFILEYDPEEAVKRFYEKDIEENKAAYEAERKAVEDWYNEQADENFDLMQDDEFINQLIKEYEQEYPEQVKGSTEEITTGEKGRGVKEAIGGEAIQEEGAKPTKEVEVPLAENPFEKTPKTQVARDKYFKQTFGENADKAEEIYNKYKDTNDFEAMQKEMQGEVPKAEKPVAEPPVPPKEEKPIETPSEEEKWTAIRKAKLEEIKGVKEMFEKETSKPWTKIQQEALEDVAKEFPKKTLNDAIRTKVERLAAKYDAKEDYNPTAKDLAVIQEFKRQTESKINAAKEELQSDNDIERFAAIAEMTSYENDLLKNKTTPLSNKKSIYNKKKIVNSCEICESTHNLETHHISEQKTADKNGFIKNKYYHKNEKSLRMIISLYEEKFKRMKDVEYKIY